jgi:diguanylate cyclase (GGDEF)-like protein
MFCDFMQPLRRSKRYRSGDRSDDKQTGSLLFKLTVPSLLTVFALWIAYTVFWAGKYENYLRSAFEESGSRAVSLFSGAVADALWEFDSGSAAATLVGLADWPGFSFASVRDQAGEFAVYDLTEGGHDAAEVDFSTLVPNTPTRIGPYLYFKKPVVHPEQGTLGSIIVAFDKRPTEQAIWEARREAAISATIGFAFLGLLLMLVARSVTKPLVRITHAVERVAAGDLSFEVPDSTASGEVGTLARALDVFRANAGRLVEAKAEMEANRRVAELAMLDDLTGLANRRALLERFAEIEKTGVSVGKVISVLHVDLDGFKQINDTIGHKAGDFVLKEVADRFQGLSLSPDSIARIGGDEFVLLVQHDPGSETPSALASEVIQSIAQPVFFEDQRLRVGASIGIAEHCAEDETMSDTLVSADIALYRAKAEGKGRFIRFDETHRQEIFARKLASDQILDGLEHQRFVPYFQGIFEAGTLKLHAVELLARWQHPTRGILPPSEFIDIAGDLNLLRHIDKIVFSKAIEVFRTLASTGRVMPRLTVNVSVSRLVERDFVEMLEAAIASGISIEVELLESVFLDEPSDTLLWQLDRIRELGVGLSIDDFGTGHASVAGLVQIRPDKVKLDRRFVIPMFDSNQARSLVQTLHGLCTLLDIDTVAEGVETMEHATLLAELGCHFLQGYALMQPVSARGLEDVLAEDRRQEAS